MKPHSTKKSKEVITRLILKVVIVIFLVDLMLTLGTVFLINEKINISLAVLNSVILSIISVPFIYYFILKPYQSKHKALRQQLYQLATYDYLTGLANRALMIELLDTILSQHEREGKIGAVLYIDINEFKQLNASHGHEAGDQALIFIADKLNRIVRSGDLASRSGGDKFVVLLQTIGETRLGAADNIKKICRRLYLSTEEGFQHKNKNIPITINIGATLFPTKINTASNVINLAAQAMHEAKKNSALDYVCNKESMQNIPNQTDANHPT